MDTFTSHYPESLQRHDELCGGSTPFPWLAHGNAKSPLTRCRARRTTRPQP